MKSILLILYFFAFGSKLYAQKEIYIKNDISYSFGYVSSDLDVRTHTMTPSKYIVLLNISDGQKKYYMSLDSSDWLNLLNQKDCDYATNLVLYFFTEKDATILRNKNRDSWLHTDKKDDYIYWKKYLKENINDLKKRIEEFNG